MYLSEAWELAFKRRDWYLNRCRELGKKPNWIWLVNHMHRTVRVAFQR